MLKLLLMKSLWSRDRFLKYSSEDQFLGFTHRCKDFPRTGAGVGRVSDTDKVRVPVQGVWDERSRRFPVVRYTLRSLLRSSRETGVSQSGTSVSLY